MNKIEIAKTIITPKFLSNTVLVLLATLIFLLIYYLINIGNKYIERNKRINIDILLLIKTLAGFICLFIVLMIFNKYKILKDTFFSIFIAMILAFIINPLVTKLEEKGIKRGYGVIIVYFAFLLIITVLIATVIPKTVQELTKLVAQAPATLDILSVKAEEISKSIAKMFEGKMFTGFNTSDMNLVETFGDKFLEILKKSQDLMISNLKNIATGISTVIYSFVKLFIVMIFSYYFVVDKDKIKTKVVELIPEKYKRDVLFVSVRINEALLGFVKGRLLMAVFVGILTMIALLIVGVDFAVIIGLITCVADIVPYIGPFLGFVPAILFALIESPMKAIWVGIIFLAIQWAENNIIAPKLLGDKVGLNPLVILLSIIIGGGMFGVLGMILGVPVVSIMMILIDFFKLKYNEKKAQVNV